MLANKQKTWRRTSGHSELGNTLSEMRSPGDGLNSVTKNRWTVGKNEQLPNLGSRERKNRLKLNEQRASGTFGGSCSRWSTFWSWESWKGGRREQGQRGAWRWEDVGVVAKGNMRAPSSEVRVRSMSVSQVCTFAGCALRRKLGTWELSVLLLITAYEFIMTSK